MICLHEILVGHNAKYIDIVGELTNNVPVERLAVNEAMKE